MKLNKSNAHNLYEEIDFVMVDERVHIYIIKDVIWIIKDLIHGQ